MTAARARFLSAMVPALALLLWLGSPAGAEEEKKGDADTTAQAASSTNNALSG